MISDYVKTIVDNLEDFIELPNGIEQLRKMVLNLAFSGKLVPQDSTEGTADHLYKKIQNESFVTTKKILQLTLVRDDETPFKLPDSWMWLRLGNIGKIVGGGTPSTSNSHFFTDPSDINSIPWLTPADMRKQTSMYISHGKQNITQLGLSSSSAALMPKGSVIFSSRAPIGYVGIAINELATNQGFKSIVPFDGIKPEYVYWYLKFRAPDINDRAPGTTFKEISGSAFAKEIISLPPTQEQVRIAKRIYQIMEYLDTLEMKKTEREKIRASLTRSAMHSLGLGDADIALQNLEELVKTSNDLKDLEKSILTLAVSGRLVSQNIDEGTGIELCENIKTDIRKSKSNSKARKASTLFPVPSNWTWVCLNDVFDVRDGTHDSPKYVANGYPLITSKNLYHGTLDFLNVKYISEDDYLKIKSRSQVDRDDILFAMIGSIGNPAIVDTDAKFSIKNVALFKYYNKELTEPRFLLLYLKYASQRMRDISAGGVQSFVSLGFLRQYPFPVPPLGEQRRIVKKVEEIMELMRSLKFVISG